MHACILGEIVLLRSKVCHAALRPPMLHVRNSSQKLAEVQHCSRVMSGICSTKPLAGAVLDGAGSGLPPLAPPPVLCSLGVGLSASSGCASSALLLLVACNDIQCLHFEPMACTAHLHQMDC